jgi:hypothetical protein
MAELLVFLLCIQKVSISNLGLETGNADQSFVVVLLNPCCQIPRECKRVNGGHNGFRSHCFKIIIHNCIEYDSKLHNCIEMHGETRIMFSLSVCEIFLFAKLIPLYPERWHR